MLEYATRPMSGMTIESASLGCGAAARRGAVSAGGARDEAASAKAGASGAADASTADAAAPVAVERFSRDDAIRCQHG